MIDPSSIQAVLTRIIPSIKKHKIKTSTPFILGLSGLQGSGKSTWASALARALDSQHGLKTRTLSLDDLYHDHDELVALRESNPKNRLLRTRGQPGTHDEQLALCFFDDVMSVTKTDDIKLPAFDKSLYKGEGGRVPDTQWERIPRKPSLDVLIFEGWCLGFQPLAPEAVEAKWKVANLLSSEPVRTPYPIQTLADHDLESLLAVNENLRRYCDTFMGPWRFDGFVHLSTDELVNVYRWRINQEEVLRKNKGTGMTDEEVILFVKGYMPAYELYLNHLTETYLFQAKGEKIHLRIVLDSRRSVSQIDESPSP
jgi:D-glycerate 3-kinase